MGMLYFIYLLVCAAVCPAVYVFLVTAFRSRTRKIRLPGASSGVSRERYRKFSGWSQKTFRFFYKNAKTEKLLKSLENLLDKAGLSGEYSPEEYFTFCLLGTSAGFVLSCLSCFALLYSGSVEDFGPAHMFVLITLFTGLGYFGPFIKLDELIKARKKAILRALPFTLDLITVSVEAGLDFGSAVQRIVDRGEMNELNYEFYLFLNETRLGKRKIEALERMAIRIDIPAVTSILQSLMQAEELGMRIGQILRIQSQSLRTKRMQTAEKSALEAPVKMLIPLAIFIFPAVFIVLLGPMIIQFMTRGG